MTRPAAKAAAEARPSAVRKSKQKPAIKQQRAGKETDFFVWPSSNHFFNSVWLLRPATPQAVKHLGKYYRGPGHSWSGDCLAVETNYVEGLVEHLRGQGFTILDQERAA